jgi:tRNA (guanine37-N1)-methyltransferase
MRIDILTAVPNVIKGPLEASILKRASDKQLTEYHIHNLHEYTTDKNGRIDDTVYGGGAGMVLAPQPIFDCIESLCEQRNYSHIIYMAPDGQQLQQDLSNKLSLAENLIIVCGHYKGIDQRIRDRLITLEISIGDYVLTGGELPALVLIDSVVRLLPGVLGDAESALTDSFQNENHLLEGPIYTRPANFKGMQVPEILQSGNHKLISEWNHNQAIEKTKQRRPDLYQKFLDE